ncbi:uncharacterized protein G2W53_026671 [Senna tora]|uniref:Uncharacterized protein n=1 Tax=Senna tora TaxID=362788 RepID=A0A834THN8_9FABA|nr:uncharacterized protein G2W53_026671 [Senna tora]
MEKKRERKWRGSKNGQWKKEEN